MAGSRPCVLSSSDAATVFRGEIRLSSLHNVKGLKMRLPSKPCFACGRPMSWRRAWAKNWAEVRYCSEACRRRKTVPR